MKMKALTLWQPWAQLIAVRGKTIETRSWSTPYTGWLAIHAAKKYDTAMRETALEPPFSTVLAQGGYSLGKTLPTSAIVAVCRLDGCYPITNIRDPRDLIRSLNGAEHEMAFGDFHPGRVAWKLTAVSKLYEPYPISGKMGLWNVDEEVAAQIMSLVNLRSAERL